MMACVAEASVSLDQSSFDITETALVTIGRVRLRGFGLSIDDYDTNLSSLHRLALVAKVLVLLKFKKGLDSYSIINTECVLVEAGSKDYLGQPVVTREAHQGLDRARKRAICACPTVFWVIHADWVRYLSISAQMPSSLPIRGG
jgi:hypothetical protein